MLSEYFAEESADAFWGFIKAFGDKLKAESRTPQTLYDTVLEVANDVLVSDKVQVLKLALALRTYQNNAIYVLFDSFDL